MISSILGIIVVFCLVSCEEGNIETKTNDIVGTWESGITTVDNDKNEKEEGEFIFVFRDEFNLTIFKKLKNGHELQLDPWFDTTYSIDKKGAIEIKGTVLKGKVVSDEILLTTDTDEFEIVLKRTAKKNNNIVGAWESNSLLWGGENLKGKYIFVFREGYDVIVSIIVDDGLERGILPYTYTTYSVDEKGIITIEFEGTVLEGKVEGENLILTTIKKIIEIPLRRIG